MSESNTTHEIEAELRGLIPRPVRYSRSAMLTRRWLWNLIPAVLSVAYLLVLRDVNHLERLRTHGVQIMARVTDKTETHGKNTSYKIDYEFNAGNDVVDARMSVTWIRYIHVEIGDQIPVTCMPDNHEEYEPEIVTTQTVMAAQERDMTIAFFCLLGYGLLVLFLECYFSSRLRLLREGWPAVAEVTGRRVVKGKSTAYFLEYSFRHPKDHRVETSSASVTKQVCENCVDGTEFTVLIMPDSRRSAVPYYQLTEAEIVGAARTVTGIC